MVLAGDAATVSGLPPHDQDQHHPQGHVQTMETGEHVEGAGEQIGGQPEGEAEVLLHLSGEKHRSQDGRDQQPQAARGPLATP